MYADACATPAQAKWKDCMVRVPRWIRIAAVSTALAAQIVVASSGGIQVVAAESVPTGAYGEGPGATGMVTLPGDSSCSQPEVLDPLAANNSQDCSADRSADR
jgi:hypothetical protein